MKTASCSSPYTCICMCVHVHIVGAHDSRARWRNNGLGLLASPRCISSYTFGCGNTACMSERLRSVFYQSYGKSNCVRCCWSGRRFSSGNGSEKWIPSDRLRKEHSSPWPPHGQSMLVDTRLICALSTQFACLACLPPKDSCNKNAGDCPQTVFCRG